MDNSQRTIEDVEYMLEHAKLDKNDLQSQCQNIILLSDGFPEDMKFLEMNTELAEEVLNGDRILVIRGDPTESAVLCTKNSTYELKEATTSNALLLLPMLTLSKEMAHSSERSLVSREAIAISQSYMEAKVCRPKLTKLKEMLKENMYCGPEYEEDKQENKYTYEDMLDKVQASDHQINDELVRLRAHEIEDYWRILEPEYQLKVDRFIFDLIISNSWSSDSIPKTQLLDTLEELVPRSILEQSLAWYTSDSEDETVSLLEDPVCRFFAKVLLGNSSKFALDDFLEHWQTMVPENMKTDINQIKGLALIDLSSKPEYVCYFPEAELPDDLNQRFKILFQMREKWTCDDIFPYLEKLIAPNQTVNSLLLKHARTSSHQGVKLYSSKYPNSF